MYFLFVTRLYKVPGDSGEKIDILDWSVSLDWPVYEDEDYLKTERDLYAMLDEILKSKFTFLFLTSRKDFCFRPRIPITHVSRTCVISFKYWVNPNQILYKWDIRLFFNCINSKHVLNESKNVVVDVVWGTLVFLVNRAVLCILANFFKVVISQRCIKKFHTWFLNGRQIFSLFHQYFSTVNNTNLIFFIIAGNTSILVLLFHREIFLVLLWINIQTSMIFFFVYFDPCSKCGRNIPILTKKI